MMGPIKVKSKRDNHEKHAPQKYKYPCITAILNFFGSTNPFYIYRPVILL